MINIVTELLKSIESDPIELAVWVDKNWRLTFRFDGVDAVMVDYRDYQ
jgi:plasmid maintenance system killer protein